MNESSKTKRLWTNREWRILSGEGIDIGCGPDPVKPDAVPFDVQHGDANEITKFVHRNFDYVYSSHCLEHMHDPRKAVQEWWKLVKPGGHLFFIVPDEDLYEQGVFPSRFNSDHKATFTISKHQSWSPVSINLLDLVLTLPDAAIVSIELHDKGYDRRLHKHGLEYDRHTIFSKMFRKAYQAFKRRTGITFSLAEAFLEHNYVIDQTVTADRLAQIQCIIRKVD